MHLNITLPEVFDHIWH